MLGDLIYQHTGKVTSIRVLDTAKSKMEATVIASGKLKDVGYVNITITYWNIRSPDGTLYGEGQGVITAKDSGNETAASVKVTEYGVGKYSNEQQQQHHHHPHKQIVWRGSTFYQSSSSDTKFSFLNNIVGVLKLKLMITQAILFKKSWNGK